jgi:type III secretory pathway component EscV
MSYWARWQGLLLPLGIVACVMVMIVPLPAALLDMLLAANIAAAVIILLTSLHVRTPLEFSLFPTLLLTTTLGRLVLNVASTRLILTHAPETGLDAAGQVIRGFGEFVTGNHILIGLVIFLMIVVIQFVVITKGAARISEVAARFALDGMPGRQMAIDADLNAGLIDEHEAQRRRQELTEQADFYGAMDGASKFVRGDAIAGVMITAINLLGGLLLGVFEAKMTLIEAGSVFSRLTVGDGLVSQMPALVDLDGGRIAGHSQFPPDRFAARVPAAIVRSPASAGHRRGFPGIAGLYATARVAAVDHRRRVRRDGVVAVAVVGPARSGPPPRPPPRTPKVSPLRKNGSRISWRSIRWRWRSVPG